MWNLFCDNIWFWQIPTDFETKREVIYVTQSFESITPLWHSSSFSLYHWNRSWKDIYQTRETIFFQNPWALKYIYKYNVHPDNKNRRNQSSYTWHSWWVENVNFYCNFKFWFESLGNEKYCLREQASKDIVLPIYFIVQSLENIYF